jgi:hypothetical protein
MEARVSAVRPRVGSGGAPAMADGAKVHVGVEVVGGKEKLG